MIPNLLIVSALMPVIMLVILLITIFITSAKWSIDFGKFGLNLNIFGALGTLLYLLSANINHLIVLNTEALGALLRLDTLSATMYLMVSVIGFVVLRFSQTYLQGEYNQSVFIKRLLLTIAFVQLMILSGNLITLFAMWIATSISLQNLILYYKERIEAKRAVIKKFIVARISDSALLIAIVLLYVEFGSFDLEIIFQGLKLVASDQIPINLELAGIFIVLAAVVKSVQIPFHGWLLDVMESPTPVSALLHAGLLNAGPFLIIRFAYLMELTSMGSIVLLVLGGLSALYGTIVFPSQPSVKTGLAYSSIGHMGFSLMICGMGLYSASLLHLIAHSFYKAHSFLSSGSAIDRHRSKQLKGEMLFNANFWNVMIGTLITVVLYFEIAQLFGGASHNTFQVLFLGAIIITGVASYVIRIVSFKDGFKVILTSIIISGFVLTSFFILEGLISRLLGNQIPELIYPDSIIQSLAIALLFLYTLTVFLPMFRGQRIKKTTLKWQIYRRNGFYVHLLFDRLISSIYPKMYK